MMLAARLRTEMLEEIPTRLHTSEIEVDGSPAMSPEFVRYITRGTVYRGTAPMRPDHTRATVAMRTLRRESRREFEVAYRILVNGWDLETVARWMGRSKRDAEVIAACALGKVDAWMAMTQA